MIYMSKSRKICCLSENSTLSPWGHTLFAVQAFQPKVSQPTPPLMPMLFSSEILQLKLSAVLFLKLSHFMSVTHCSCWRAPVCMCVCACACMSEHMWVGVGCNCFCGVMARGACRGAGTLKCRWNILVIIISLCLSSEWHEWQRRTHSATRGPIQLHWLQCLRESEFMVWTFMIS